MSPSLALGQAVHEVIESLSVLPVAQRFSESLLTRYESAWKKVAGDKGGFSSSDEEHRIKERGAAMLTRVMQHPGILKNKAVKIHKDLPYFWISEEDNIILCGRIDWLEYLEQSDSVHIVDFKTGKYEEKSESLQLPIYCLIVKNTQQRPVTKVSYWYLDRNDEPGEVAMPDLTLATEKIIETAKKIKVQKALNHFKCPLDGCASCKPLEKIVAGEAKFVGVNEFNQRDTYVVLQSSDDESLESSIL